MRTIETKVYLFDELSEEAKENAINRFRDDSYSCTPWFIDEVNKSFEKFADLFSIKWQNIDYEEPYRNNYDVNFDDDILELTGQRLATYIWNNYKSDLFKGKYYGKLVDTSKDGKKIEISKDHPAGVRHVQRYSKCQLDNCCVLTGVCYDDDLLIPIYEFLDKPKDLNIETLLNDCIYSLCHSVSSEIEYRNSDEAITEDLIAYENEYEKNGDIM